MDRISQSRSERERPRWRQRTEALLGQGYFDGDRWKDAAAAQPVVPEPAQEEVWNDCLVSSSTYQGQTTARITWGDQELVIDKVSWPAFVRQLSDQQKKAAKKGRLQVRIRVRRQGARLELVELLEALS